MAQGAYSLHARSVLPTSSSTNWASMIMGEGPEQHGITSNSWEKDNFILPAVTQSEDFLFPTIFHLVDDQIEYAEVGAIYHWTGFGRLFEKNAVDYDVSPDTEEETEELASNYIKSKKPDLHSSISITWTMPGMNSGMGHLNTIPPLKKRMNYWVWY